MTKQEALACYERLIQAESGLKAYLSTLQQNIDDLEALSGYYLTSWAEDKKRLKEIPFPELYQEEAIMDTFERWLESLDELIDIAESLSIEG